MTDGFTLEELTLSYLEWKALADVRKSTLDPIERSWLCEWEAHDLMASPRDDKERCIVRYGHHLGYFAAIRAYRPSYSVWPGLADFVRGKEYFASIVEVKAEEKRSEQEFESIGRAVTAATEQYRNSAIGDYASLGLTTVRLLKEAGFVIFYHTPEQ